MNQDEQKYGKPNANAPAELSLFAFLIGKWRCEGQLTLDDGGWQNLNATWEGRYILDGYVIAEDYRMTTPEGKLLVLGMNVRAYDTESKSWNMKWLSALAGTWVDLGAEELGGVKADERAIVYAMKEPLAPHKFTRAMYTNFSENHFTWRGERSDDGKTWEGFLTIECYRELEKV